MAEIDLSVLHIVGGSLSEGAARGAFWLHQGLLQYGADSKFAVQLSNNQSFERVESIAKSSLEKTLRAVRTALDKLPVQLYRNRPSLPFSTGTQGFDIRKLESYQSANIIHLHWINQGTLDIKLLKQIEKPIVWTLRDMWPLTGGCHYSLSCKRYEQGCGLCPQLNSRSIYDLSKYLFWRKARSYPDSMKVVAISNWLAEQARQSQLMARMDIRVIHNCVSLTEFFPVETKIARKALGLPHQYKIVLTGANNLEATYKGFSKFIEAIDILTNSCSNYLILLFGKHLSVETITCLQRVRYRYLGFLNDHISLRLAYSAADVFVSPSIQEAFGKTLIESMACGTPTVAFNIAGPKDIVEQRVSGYLATPFLSEDLASGIEWIAGDSCRAAKLGENAVCCVKKKFSSSVIAPQYIDLYREMLR